MFPSLRRASAPVLLVCALLASACGTADLTLSESDLSQNEPFVRVSREALSPFAADGGALGLTSPSEDTFYLAVHKSQLGQKWFLSAYLTQWHPSENTPVRSLGTRVVSFKVQNGKLFVFDVTDGHAWSDVLDPSVIVEAWPVVTTNAEFNALPGASNYVLFDPAAGLNRFGVEGDELAQQYWARFQTDLTFLQGFKALPDGVSWEEVFTGYTELPGPGLLDYSQPFRGSGTLRMTLRRYQQSPDFTPTEYTETATRPYFWASNWQYVKNEPRYRQWAVKWNIRPGMQPIDWRISKSVEALERDPRLTGVDVRGAITRGVERWNDAFGFPVFRVVPTGAGDSPGDDDKNFIVVDPNPGAGLAFANWRENPNTGEIRGASVYFSAAFVYGALGHDGGAPEDAGQPLDAGVDVDAGSAADAGGTPDAGVSCAPALVISQVFGGNSNAGVFNQDFVELHNRTSAAVSVSGLSLQYGAASGTAWQVLPLSGSVAPGGYFLIGLNTAGDGGVALPQVDLRGGLSLSLSAGKVALVEGTTAATGACPTGPAVLDFVGYGATNCAEGAFSTPTLSASTSALRLDQGCTDTNVNFADFSTGAPAPRSTLSAAYACTCTAPAAVTPPSSAVDGGVALVPPPATGRPAARLVWEPMTPGETCALDRHQVATIPEGMTRRDFIENVITHTILHEVGHTLSLRHNFKGSLQGSSVMDYTRDEDASLMPRPGAWDIAAVRYLYGLDTAPASQPFCTDEDTWVDASCDRWDTGANPLATDLGPAFTAKVRQNLAETRGLLYADIHTITRYVRAPGSEAQRLEAFNLLMGEVAPPLRADVLALGPNAEAWADTLAVAFLQNLFVDPAEWRDPIAVNPSLADATFRARVAAVAKDMLVNSDGHRFLANRRVVVDVLKAMQTDEAYDALVTARVALVAERARYNAQGQAQIDDLLRRLDLACSPYFR
ncbi:MAG: zinc-dependent metalloprotease [Myxococcales bacterium]|nr:zinc-dependent metalloprotease [Myxococcales bacterium]